MLATVAGRRRVKRLSVFKEWSPFIFTAAFIIALEIRSPTLVLTSTWHTMHARWLAGENVLTGGPAEVERRRLHELDDSKVAFSLPGSEKDLVGNITHRAKAPDDGLDAVFGKAGVHSGGLLPGSYGAGKLKHPEGGWGVHTSDSPRHNLQGGSDEWTETPEGCPCFYDPERLPSDCACCSRGAVQCGKVRKDRCVPPGKGGLCTAGQQKGGQQKPSSPKSMSTVDRLQRMSSHANPTHRA